MHPESSEPVVPASPEELVLATPLETEPAAVPSLEEVRRQGREKLSQWVAGVKEKVKKTMGGVAEAGLNTAAYLIEGGQVLSIAEAWRKAQVERAKAIPGQVSEAAAAAKAALAKAGPEMLEAARAKLRTAGAALDAWKSELYHAPGRIARKMEIAAEKKRNEARMQEAEHYFDQLSTPEARIAFVKRLQAKFELLDAVPEPANDETVLAA